MENPIIVPFDLNTARKIKSGEIEGSVLIGNIKIEFVYESKDCADRYNLLFVKKDESGISAIYADTEGRTFFNNVLEREIVDDYNRLPYKYECSNGTLWDCCIPFEGNECLLETAENPEK